MRLQNILPTGPSKRLLIGATGTLLLLVLLAIAAGWYYSSLLLDGAFKPDYSPDALDVRVVSVSDDRITLEPESSAARESLEMPGIWGLEAVDAYGQAGEILASEGSRISRGFTPMRGSIRPGDMVRLDSFAFDGNPQQAFGLAFHEVLYSAELGDMSAWLLPGSKDTWVVLVHGWRSEKEEALRILPLLDRLDYPALVIDYRNDEQAPASPDGLIRFGTTEWRDLEAAISFAQEQGAKDVVLFGYSMGGAIVFSFLFNSDAAQVVKAAILDAPMLDFNAVVDFEAEKRNLPGFITWLGKQFSTFRFDVDWGELNYLKRADQLQLPILLFHADGDDRVPVETSDRLASMRPDLVVYHRVSGPGHVRAWNLEPVSYESVVEDFLLAVTKPGD